MKIDHGLEKYGWVFADALTDHAYTFPAINALLPPGNLKILNAGCGNGFIAGQLAALGHKVLAVDISEDGIAIARKKYPSVSFAVRSIYDGLCDLTEPVDVVISSE